MKTAYEPSDTDCTVFIEFLLEAIAAALHEAINIKQTPVETPVQIPE